MINQLKVSSMFGFISVNLIFLIYLFVQIDKSSDNRFKGVRTCHVARKVQIRIENQLRK